MGKSSGPKPVHLRAANGKPVGRNAVWAAIRTLNTFTILDLEGETREDMSTIRTYVMGLERAGYLQRLDGGLTDKGQYSKGHWRLIKDIGVERPRVDRYGKEVTQGRGREQMWRTMKIVKDFNKHELALQASTETHPVKVNEASYYLGYLYRAGYLLITAKSKPGTPARYRLLRSKITGPQPPMIQRLDQVFDPNLQEVVWTAEQKAVDL